MGLHPFHHHSLQGEVWVAPSCAQEASAPVLAVSEKEYRANRLTHGARSPIATTGNLPSVSSSSAAMSSRHSRSSHRSAAVASGVSKGGDAAVPEPSFDVCVGASSTAERRKVFHFVVSFSSDSLST